MKKIIFAVLGVAGAGALGYYAYQRYYKGNSAITLLNQTVQAEKDAQASTLISQGTATGSQTLLQYEGKGFRDTGTKKIYKVVNGVLRHITTMEALQREFGSPSTENLIDSKVIQQVNTDFINQFPIGQPLSGLSGLSTKLLF